MKINIVKVVPILLAMAALAFTGKAEAQILTGSISFSGQSSASFNGTTLTLPANSAITASSASGDFTTLLPTGFDGLTIAPTTLTFTGNTANIPGGIILSFVLFANTDGGLNGTTPANKFEFDLTSLTVGTNVGNTCVFAGTGMSIDTDAGDGFTTTSLNSTIGFTVSGSSNSGSLPAAP